MDEGVGQRRPIVLVMEADPLLRWSLTTYLGRFFTVFAIGSLEELDHTVHAEHLDAIVASDDLASDAETLFVRIRQTNLAIVAVQMVAATSGADVVPNFVPIEKPFQLDILADLLWSALKEGCGTKNNH
jgi:DNA-binding NtrC family response regulator